MKIFLDDSREINPKYSYSYVRTYEECIILLSVFSKDIKYQVRY